MEWSVILAIGLAVVAVATAVWASALLRDNRHLAKERENLRGEKEACESQLRVLIGELAGAKAKAEELKERMEHERAEQQQLRDYVQHEFKLLAGEILEEKSKQFKATNRESLEVLLKPFRDSMVEFRERVEKIHSEDLHQRGAIQNEIEMLHKLNQRITEETTNLTRALKGSGKVQGDWGEMILETILENSNLQRGVHYLVQENFRNEEGRNVRPDVVLNLPEGKQVVIDSKVSLTAFVGYVNAESEADRDSFLREHLRSVRAHVAELAAKSYQTLPGLNQSPDFVILFMANEPAFLTALQHDSTIWSEAYEKKVIISSPTNLFALLRIVDDLWKRDTQSRNALDIAAVGAKLYDKFVGFVSSLEDVGRGIDALQRNYEKAYKQLSGKGSLVSHSQKLVTLGVKASKKLPAKLIEESVDEETEEPDSEI